MSSLQRIKSKTKRNETASPSSGESVFILVGKIRRPHGVVGEILLQPFSESTGHFEAGKTIYVGQNHISFVVDSRRDADGMQLVHLQGIDTPEEAGVFRNKDVYVTAESLPELPEGEYYHYQLIGLTVEDEKGAIIGVLNEVIFTGANNVYVVVADNGEETLLPAIPSVILSIDIRQKRMVVRPQEWL